jgi:adenylate cyclase
MTWRNLFEELRRRRVYRVAAGYVIAAFALLQAADIVLPALDFPAWTMRLVVLLAIAGLPVAVILAWIFDVTPRGIERTATDPAERVSTRAMATGIAGVVLVALLVGAAIWRVTRRPSDTAVAATAAQTAPVQSASVAVLPCIDVSAGREHEYFGDGITEEIIGELARFAGLKVISRTSVVALKDSRLTLPQIADTLRVGHVLECSIQRSGTRIRVRAKLIDPRSDTQLWSDAFDRELADVVSMQEDIARHVGSALLAQLPQLRPRTSAAHSPVAYDAYLRGAAARRQLSRPGLVAAISAFEESIAADPSFAPAYSGLSQAHVMWTLFGYPGEPEPYERVAAAYRYADRAVALDTAWADAYAARAHAGLRAWQDSDVILADLDRAVRLAPGSGEIRLVRGVGLAFAGRYEEAVREAETAAALDPLFVGSHDFRAMSLVLARRYDDALRSARLARALVPGFPNPIRGEIRALLLLGRFEECAAQDAGPYLALRAMCLHSMGRGDEAQALIAALATAMSRPAAELPLNTGGIAGDIAEYHAWIGDVPGTIEWLRRSVAASPTAQFLIVDTATYDRVRDEPRFRAEFERLRGEIRQRITALRTQAG